MRTRSNIEFGVKTDVGMERTENQDGFLLFEPEDAELFRRIGRIAVVADGMGGMAGGRTANRLALRAFLGSVRAAADVDGPLDGCQLLRDGIVRANERVFQQAQADPALRGMGTTMTAIQIKDGRLCFAHVGDTRLLLIREAKIALKTKDHVEGPKSSALTRSVGVFANVEPDVGTFDLNDDDRLVLCSDGLWDLVQPQDTKAIVAAHAPAEAASRLIAAANANGGHDNVTAVVVRVVRAGADPTEPVGRPRSPFHEPPVEAMPLPTEAVRNEPDPKLLAAAAVGVLLAITGLLILVL